MIFNNFETNVNHYLLVSTAIEKNDEVQRNLCLFKFFYPVTLTLLLLKP